MEEERRGQSSRFKGPGMGGRLVAAGEVEVGAALEASEMDGKLGLAIGMELGASFGVSLVAAGAMEFRRGPYASNWRVIVFSIKVGRGWLIGHKV